MSQTKKTRDEEMEAYEAKYLANSNVEWLIEHGNPHEVVYFKGETGDRYTIYVATKRNKTTVDFTSVYNAYTHGTSKGNHIATIKNRILTMIDSSNSYWNSGCGYTIKQLMRQGVVCKKYPWSIRYCRSAYFMKLTGNPGAEGFVEFTPWIGMKIDLEKGILVNKPTMKTRRKYMTAKKQDSVARKRNALSNKYNREALARYNAAGGSTKEARGHWDPKSNKWVTPQEGAGTENINWDMIPMDDVFKHRNATLRSNILEHYGINAILETLSYDTVDIDFIDGREYKLLNVDIPDLSVNDIRMEKTRKCLYLQMINPSTGESHFEGIQNLGGWGAPKEATVIAALAWRDGDLDMLRQKEGWKAPEDKTVYIKPINLT